MGPLPGHFGSHSTNDRSPNQQKSSAQRGKPSSSGGNLALRSSVDDTIYVTL